MLWIAFWLGEDVSGRPQGPQSNGGGFKGWEVQYEVEEVEDFELDSAEWRMAKRGRK